MVTEKQIVANRRNALKSTGPRSVEGKAAASKNAVRHGLLSANVLLGDESREEFEQFRQRLLLTLAPEGELEFMLADRVVTSGWRLKRAVRIEMQMMENDVAKRRQQRAEFGDFDFGSKKSPITLGSAISTDLVTANTYGKLSRYESHIERGLYKALHELQRLQAARRGQTVMAPLALDVDVSGPAAGTN